MALTIDSGMLQRDALPFCRSDRLYLLRNDVRASTSVDLAKATKLEVRDEREMRILPNHMDI